MKTVQYPGQKKNHHLISPYLVKWLLFHHDPLILQRTITIGMEIRNIRKITEKTELGNHDIARMVNIIFSIRIQENLCLQIIAR